MDEQETDTQPQSSDVVAPQNENTLQTPSTDIPPSIATELPASPEPSLAPDPSPDFEKETDTANLFLPPAAEPTTTNPPVTREQPTHGHGKPVWAVVGILLIIFAAGGGFGAGRMTAPKPKPTPVASLADTFTLPQNATIISQCAKNRGTQYVLPKDIPLGPVYNVYNNKVIGIEYMIGKSDLIGGESYLNLPLNGQKYDHVNIGLLSNGHAGYPAPHYHVDIMTVPTSVTDKITC